MGCRLAVAARIKVSWVCVSSLQLREGVINREKKDNNNRADRPRGRQSTRGKESEGGTHLKRKETNVKSASYTSLFKKGTLHNLQKGGE